MKINALIDKINLFYKISRINVDSLLSIQKYITSESNPNVFFTMTRINKIGINPQSVYDTPLGVYCYPLTQDYFNNLIENNLPYADEMPYVNVFSISKNLQNTSQYTKEQEKEDLSKIRILYNISDEELLDILKNANKKSPISNFWYVTKKISNKNITKWNHILRNLGYNGFYDPGEGIIHSNEPTQAVILNPSIIKPIETFFNPHGDLTGLDPNLISKEDYSSMKSKIEKENDIKRMKKQSDIMSQILDKPLEIDNIKLDDLINITKNTGNDKVLSILSNSKINLIREIVAENVNTPRFTLHKLMNDNIKFIKDKAADNLLRRKL